MNKIIILTVISLFFLPEAKSGASIAVCPACASVCAIPFNPLCWICVASLCVTAPILTGCFNSDTKIYKIENGLIKNVPIYQLKKMI